MIRLSFFVLGLLLLVKPAAAYDVLVVQSVRSALYEEVLKGFREGAPASSKAMVLTDYAEVDLARVVREERPRLVVAIGDGALAAARKIRKTPVIALMALNYPGAAAPAENVKGLPLFISPQRYMALFEKLKVERVGVVHDPSKTGWYVRQARAEAKRSGVELVVREVLDSRQVGAQLDSLKGKVDGVWIIPDTTTVTPITLEQYFLFGLERRVPVVSFTATHLPFGASAVLELDLLALGRQLSVLAHSIMQGTAPAGSVVTPSKVRVRINDTVLKRLGLTVTAWARRGE